jgi:hypothetical protein
MHAFHQIQWNRQESVDEEANQTILKKKYYYSALTPITFLLLRITAVYCAIGPVIPTLTLKDGDPQKVTHPV